jgi:hypothetical protein
MRPLSDLLSPFRWRNRLDRRARNNRIYLSGVERGSYSIVGALMSAALRDFNPAYVGSGSCVDGA